MEIFQLAEDTIKAVVTQEEFSRKYDPSYADVDFATLGDHEITQMVTYILDDFCHNDMFIIHGERIPTYVTLQPRGLELTCYGISIDGDKAEENNVHLCDTREETEETTETVSITLRFHNVSEAAKFVEKTGLKMRDIEGVLYNYDKQMYLHLPVVDIGLCAFLSSVAYTVSGLTQGCGYVAMVKEHGQSIENAVSKLALL